MEFKDFFDMIDFMESLEEAQKTGNHEFTCPICGGKAKWSCSECSEQVSAKCDGCGISLVKQEE